MIMIMIIIYAKGEHAKYTVHKINTKIESKYAAL